MSIPIAAIMLAAFVAGAPDGAHARTSVFSNSASIAIPAKGPATLYPSTINVTGLESQVLKGVRVRLLGFSHTCPDDVDVLLVAPGGQSTILLSDVGGSPDAVNLNLTLDDAAAATMNDSHPGLFTGTYRPTNFDNPIEPPDSFPAPAPAAPWGATLSALLASPANGTWSLFVLDDKLIDAGSFTGGWELTLTTELVKGNPTAIAIDNATAPPTAAVPYPSSVTVSELPGQIVTSVSVRLLDFSHTSPADVDMLLVGPGGQRAVIFSDVGGTTGVQNLNVNLHDAAATGLPDVGPLLGGDFRPTNYEPGDLFPAPAPASSGASALSAFASTDPNGTWSLYIADDTPDGTGALAGGWELVLETVRPTVVLDLNGPAAGVDYATAFTEDGGPTAIVDAGLTVTDTDSPTLASATITLLDRPDGTMESLGATLSEGVTGTYDAATGILQLTGVATLATYQQILRSVTYDNLSQDPSPAVRTVTFLAFDGVATNALATSTVSVTAVNDPPTIDPPAAVQLFEGSGPVTVNLTGIGAGAGENQAISVMAYSDNPFLVPDPTVTYTSPDTTGTLTLEPLPGVAGMAFIRVVVDDLQGFASTTEVTFPVTVATAHVAPDGTGDFTTVGAALDAVCASGHPGTVKLATGTHRGNLALSAGCNFVIEGGWDASFTARSPNPALTVLSGDTSVPPDGKGDGSVVGIVALGGTAVVGRLDGLTLRGGRELSGGGVRILAMGGSAALTVDGCVVASNEAFDRGAGLFVEASPGGAAALTLRNTMVVHNVASSCGGVAVNAVGAASVATVTAQYDTIAGNQGNVGSEMCVTSADGGAASAVATGLILRDATRAGIGGDLLVAQSASTASFEVSHSDLGTVSLTGGASYLPGPGIISADPVFANPARSEFTLNADSPCIGAGPVGSLVSEDFQGDVRPTGIGSDIGADEYALPAFASLRLLAPRGREVLPAGSLSNITWGAPGNAKKFLVEYSLDGGSTWKALPAVGNVRHQAWKVPKLAANSAKAKVRVTSMNAAGRKLATATGGLFAIEVVKVTAPNGGETLRAGSPTEIRWTTRGTVRKVAMVDVFLSTNGGATWKRLGREQGNDGVRPWLPAAASLLTACKVKVVLLDAKRVVIGSDTSDKTFMITP